MSQVFMVVLLPKPTGWFTVAHARSRYNRLVELMRCWHGIRLHGHPRAVDAACDFLLRHPEIMQLRLWKRLERPNATGTEIMAYREKTATLVHAQAGFGSADRALDAMLSTVSCQRSAVVVHEPADSS
jgi:hypothetical protein